MKFKIEIDPDQPEELLLRAPTITEEISRIRKGIDGILRSEGEISLRKAETEFFLPYRDILYFETSENRVWAHTKNDCFYCALRLNELEELLPRTFTRGSKSNLVNTALIQSIRRSPTGVAEVSFRGSDKKVYISRLYYHMVRDIIEETRLSK